MLKNKTNLKLFINYQNNKNFMVFVILIILLLIALFLVVSFDSNGFDIVNISFINKYAILSIVLSGTCLGVSTYLVQHLTKNKLADTSVLGIGNCNAMSLLFMTLLLDLSQPSSVNAYNTSKPIVFMTCSILASLLLHFLSKKKDHKISKKIIIIGIFINFFFVAVANMFSNFLPSGKKSMVSPYLDGFVSQYNNESFLFCFVVIIILLIWLFFIANKFKIVSINTDIATELGINVNIVNFQIILISGAFAGIAYILVGNITFLGIISGNVATMLFKKNIKSGILSSSLVSMIILFFTFFIFTNIIPGLTNNKVNINTSHMISLISLPYFLYLIFKSE